MREDEAGGDIEAPVKLAEQRRRGSRPARALATKSPLRRLFWALARLRDSRPLKAGDLAREFEVHVRTAYRDMDFLRDEWRVPVEYDHADGTYRLTEPITSLPPVALTEGELVAIYFAEKVLRQYRGTPFEADLRSAFGKIEELLPGEVKAWPARLDDYLSLDLGPLYAPDAKVFSEVLRAFRLRRTVLVRYKSLSSNRVTDRRIRPYRLFGIGGDWYVAAWDERRKEVRDFALHRIRRLTLTTERYEVPPDFRFEAYMADAFGIEKGRPVAVAIRFAPRQARWIRERKWHRSARIQEEIGGGLVLRLRVADTSELRRWILQFGREAEVLAPAALRKAVAAEIAAAGRAYQRGRRR